MGDKLRDLIIFAIGATAGSFVTYKALKTKYEKLANSEIREVREYYDLKLDEYLENKESIEEDISEPVKAQIGKLDEKPNIKEYASVVQNSGYLNEEPYEEHVDGPYVIEPCEFGLNDGYSETYLVLYDDGVLADDMDCPVEDINYVVGEDNLEEMGKYEDNILHIRNDKLRSDYEITKDLRSFYEVVGDK